MNRTPKIFITMEGGIIQHIYADSPVDIIVADFDEGITDDPRLMTINGDKAYVVEEDPEINEKATHDLFQQVQNGGQNNG